MRASIHASSAAFEPARPADFQFWLTPYRSMSHAAFAGWIAVILAMAVALLIFFLAIGMWPAAVASLLDGLFLAAAFVACRRDRRRLETVTLCAGMLSVTRRWPNGEVMFAGELPAFDLTVHETIDPDYGCQKLQLHQHARTIEVGGELSPAERCSFAQALVTSLRQHGQQPRTELTWLPARAGAAR